MSFEKKLLLHQNSSKLLTVQFLIRNKRYALLGLLIAVNIWLAIQYGRAFFSEELDQTSMEKRIFQHLKLDTRKRKCGAVKYKTG